MLLVRLCPVAFAMSNVIFGAIPEIKVSHFALATFISLWKNLFVLWIGSRLSKLSDNTDIDPLAKRANYIFLMLGILLLIGTTWYIYHLTMKKIYQLAARKHKMITKEVCEMDNEDKLLVNCLCSDNISIELQEKEEL